MPVTRRGSWWACALVGGLLGLAGCGDASLDAAGSTAASSTGSGSDSGTGESSTGAEPVEICDPRCSPRLEPSWSFQGEPGTQAVSMLMPDEQGRLHVAVQRATGVFELVTLWPDGELERVRAPQLPCTTCTVEDMALHPSGDLLISATDHAGPWNSSAVLARFSLEEGTLKWVRSTFFSDNGTGMGRAGAVVALGNDRIVQFILDEYVDGELLALHDTNGDGEFQIARTVFNQIMAEGRWPILAEASPGGELVVAHPGWDYEFDPPELVGETRRLLPPTYDFLTRQVLPLRLDDLALDSRGSRLELSRSDDVETITLLLTNRSASDLERWDINVPLLSTSSTRAVLAVGPDDDAYIAARITPRGASQEFFVVELAVTRISSDGDIRWQASLPLDIRANHDPLRVTIDGDDGIVVATVVQGQLYVARFEQGCTCE